MNSVWDTPCGVGFPIRTSADQRSLASPRGFSQRATSFIASWRQGIHRTPFSCSRMTPTPPARRTKPRMAISDHRPPDRHAIGAGTTHALANFTHISDKPSHPTARISPSRQGRQFIRQIRFTVSKNMPAPGLSPGRKLCEGSRELHPTWRPHFTMEASGFEPLTPCLQSRCSTS